MGWCEKLLNCNWQEGLDLAEHPARLRQQLLQGVEGAPTAVVRWYKLAFAHSKHLAKLCDTAGTTERALALVSGGLSSADPEVALWSSRLLCRLAADLTQRGLAVPMWQWFSGSDDGGAGLLVDVWSALPDLHAAGALMPLVLHLSGEKLHLFLSTVLPRYLTESGAFQSFVLELLPLLAPCSTFALWSIRRVRRSQSFSC